MSAQSISNTFAFLFNTFHFAAQSGEPEFLYARRRYGCAIKPGAVV
jgi:hypothetical protein